MHKKEITLPEVLGSAAFNELRDELIEAVIHDGEIAINAAQVERLSTPCAQLIAAFLQIRKSQNQQATIGKFSPNFHAAWSDLGLDDLKLGEFESNEALNSCFAA